MAINTRMTVFVVIGWKYTMQLMQLAAQAMKSTNRRTVSNNIYYSGHRKHHCLHTQVVIDNTGWIPHVKCGFLWHMNDTQNYCFVQEMPIDLPLPDNRFLLAANIYPNGYPVLSIIPMLRHSYVSLVSEDTHGANCPIW